jgi:HK97 family phage major capsid protein
MNIHTRALRGHVCYAVAAMAALRFMPQIAFDAPDKFASLSDVKALTEKLAEITGKFQAKSDELAKHSEAALAEIKAKGQLLEETKAQADKLLVEQTKLTGEKNEIAARLQSVEAHVAKRDSVGGPEARKSIGTQMIEDEKVKAFIEQARGGYKGAHRFTVKAVMKSTDSNIPPVQPGVMMPDIAAPLPRLVQRLFVRDIIDVGQTSAPAIAYVRQTGFTNNAAVVSEGDTKPTSTIAYDTKMEAVRTIAHLFKASKQILDDMPMLRTDVDREMRYGVKYAEEQEILFGDGTGVHLHGIVPQASAYHHAFVAANHTKIDDIRLAMLQSQLARLPATGIVMHYTDWASIELTKDSTGQYLWANPLRVGGMTLWGLPVVPTEISALQGKLLVGAFATAATLYDREEVNVEIATQNDVDFEKNLLTIRCEERVALAVRRPEAFIYGTFIVTT